MNSYIKMIVRPLVFSAAALLFLTFNHSVVRADEFNFTGSAGVCFSASTCTTAGQAQTSSIAGLHYHGSTFDVTTSNGFAPVGNLANPGSNFNNFGSFTLDSIPNNYLNEITIRLIFTSPSNVDPSRFFNGTFIGSVITTNTGGVQLIFPQNGTRFATTNGFFDVTFNPLAITPGQGPVALTGSITSGLKPVPEPATLILLGTGLLGVVAKIRKRRES